MFSKRMAETVSNMSNNDDDKIVPITPDDWDVLEDSIEKVLTAFGWDMTNPSIEGTPARFLRYLKEFHQPWTIEDVLGKPFESPDNSMVIQSNIPFRSICEHHLLPALGYAAVGYIPKGKVIGLSKMTRLVQAIGTEKPSLQEHISDKIANTLQGFLQPRGVMVVITAIHNCMACRGVNKPNVPTTTSTTRGVFFEDQAARMEFLSLMRGL